MVDEKQRSAIKQAHVERLRCLVLPVGDMSLMLPNTTVAEVTFINQVREIENTPDWFVGISMWRGVEIPLISFSKLMGQSDDVDKRVAVLNLATGGESGTFVAMYINGLPKLAHISKDMIDYSDEEVSIEGKPVLSVMVYDGATVFVPDLDHIEKKLEQVKI